MLDLLSDLLFGLLCRHDDPDIDSTRGAIALFYVVVFIVLVVLISAAILEIRQG